MKCFLINKLYKLKKLTSKNLYLIKNGKFKPNKKVEKNIFRKPLIIYKITSDDALLYCLKIIQYFLNLSSVEKIFVEDLTLIQNCFLIDKKEFDFLKKTINNSINKIYQFYLNENSADICIVIGGDGTILWANHIFQNETRPPFLAFNLGTLGYMATYCSEGFECILDDVLDPKTPIYYEKRTFLKGKLLLNLEKKETHHSKQNLSYELKRSSSEIKTNSNFTNDSNLNLDKNIIKSKKLSCNEKDPKIRTSQEFFKSKFNDNNYSYKSIYNIDNNKFLSTQIEHTEFQIDYNETNENKIIYALNDITIERKDISHMINTKIYYNNEPLTIIKSNGIIIASPTGSTAYSLSAGGTIMHFGLDCFILNSICPHSLSFRPIAFPRGDKLKIVITQDSKDAIIINDGINKFNLSHCQGIEVEISDKFVEFILTEKFNEIKSKMWKQKIINQLGWNNAFRNVEMGELNSNVYNENKEI